MNKILSDSDLDFSTIALKRVKPMCFNGLDSAISTAKEISENTTPIYHSYHPVEIPKEKPYHPYLTTNSPDEPKVPIKTYTQLQHLRTINDHKPFPSVLPP